MVALARHIGTIAYGNAYLLLTLATLLWGGNTVAGRLAVGEVSPMVVVFLRWALVAVIMLPLLWTPCRRDWPAMKPKFIRITLMSLFGFVGFNTLFYHAAIYSTAVNIGIIQGSMPVLVLIGSLLFFGTRIRPLQALGIVATLFGVAMIAAQGSLEILLALQVNIGDGLMFTACIFYSVYTLALRDRPKVSGLSFFTVMAAISAVASIPGLIYEIAAGDVQWPTFEGWLVVLYIALGPSCLSQIFFMRGVELIGPARAGIFINLVPIFGSVFAVNILGEPFQWHHGLALALVLGGIWLSERKAN